MEIDEKEDDNRKSRRSKQGNQQNNQESNIPEIVMIDSLSTAQNDHQDGKVMDGTFVEPSKVLDLSEIHQTKENFDISSPSKPISAPSDDNTV